MSFTDFQFHPKIKAGISACGYSEPTPIQKAAIPPLLAGRDILGLAQTGTGKTAAFVLPLLQRLLDGPRNQLRALIVAPTRELAEQINANITAMAQMTDLKSCVVYGGVGKQPQIHAIRSGAEIVVACPGRLLDLLNGKSFNLRAVEVLVLDEADHMFDKGFLPDIRRIMQQLPAKRQSMVFSATMPKEIRHLATQILQDPATVQINHAVPAPTISHAIYQVAREQKTVLLKCIIDKQQMTSTLVFTRTKHKARSLARNLENSGYKATSLQGNLSQQKRQQAMDGFRDGTFNILVATDIAARGIDVDGISHVINYDMPDTAETYTHRTGRTGRATRTGQAFTFTGPEDAKMIALIERNLGKKIIRETLPELAGNVKEMCGKKTQYHNSRPAAPKKKPAVRLSKNRRSRASAFDFGINNVA